jgi:hypothetical protein
MKFLDIITNSLKCSKPYNIDGLCEHFNCEPYDIIFSLISNGLLSITKNGFKLSNTGKNLMIGTNIKGYMIPIDVCNLIMYDLIFSKNNPSEQLGKIINAMYNGDTVIESTSLDKNHTVPIIKIIFKPS